MRENLCCNNNILSGTITSNDVYVFYVYVDYLAEYTGQCNDYDNKIVITDEISDASNPYTSSGISISGFQAGGTICYDDLDISTSEPEQRYGISNSNQTIGGLISAEYCMESAISAILRSFN